MATKKERYPWENSFSDVKQKLKGSSDYKKGVNDFFEEVSKNRILNSQHQLNDKVVLDFFKEGTVTGCQIIKVHFTESKVLYDVEITSTYKNPANGKWSTRLYNIDGCFVKPWNTVAEQ